MSLSHLNVNAIKANPSHVTHLYTAMPRRAPFHHRLMIRSHQEERSQPTRINLFEP
jgi:hypothetical protein